VRSIFLFNAKKAENIINYKNDLKININNKIVL